MINCGAMPENINRTKNEIKQKWEVPKSIDTAQKIKFFINGFFSKCDHFSKIYHTRNQALLYLWRIKHAKQKRPAEVFYNEGCS